MATTTGARRTLGLPLAVAVLALAPTSRAADSERVKFDSVDGVRLQGTFYPAKGKGKEKAVVLLLHNVEFKKGGNSTQDGWGALAEALQKDNYAVLTFDFRGHGDSTAIGPSFWKDPYEFNRKNIRTYKPTAREHPDTISHADFSQAYYAGLINDVAAAKAYLDRRNDVNSSNLLLIGAGEGATIGAGWMLSEWHRAQAIAPPMAPGLPPKLDDPEGRAQVAAVWLTISPSIAGRPVPVVGWLKELEKRKVRQAFVYGKDDSKADNFTLALLKNLRPGYQRKDDEKTLPMAGEKAIKGTSLTGSQLLKDGLSTQSWIVKTYLDAVMDKHTRNENLAPDASKETIYFWTFDEKRPTLAKGPKERLTALVPLDRLGIK